MSHLKVFDNGEMFWLGDPKPMSGITIRKELKIIPATNQNWAYFACDCCKWTYYKRVDGDFICAECKPHDRTKPCELVCVECGEPSHKHPVTRPGIECTHKGIVTGYAITNVPAMTVHIPNAVTKGLKI